MCVVLLVLADCNLLYCRLTLGQFVVLVLLDPLYKNHMFHGFGFGFCSNYITFLDSFFSSLLPSVINVFSLVVYSTFILLFCIFFVYILHLLISYYSSLPYNRVFII